MLTIINIKTGEITVEQMDHIAAGQVLLKNCSDEFIHAISTYVRAGANTPVATKPTAAASSLTSYTKAPAAVDYTEQWHAIAAQHVDQQPSKGCCGKAGCSERPSEKEVTAKLADLNKKISKLNSKSIKVKAPKVKSITELREELALALVSSDSFVESVQWLEEEPTHAKRPPINYILAGLCLYAHFGTETAFSAGQAAEVIDLPRSNVRKLAIDYDILCVDSGTLAATKYTVTASFATSIAEALGEAEYQYLRELVADLEEQIANPTKL